jgi:hypothetical protein
MPRVAFGPVISMHTAKVHRFSFWPNQARVHAVWCKRLNVQDIRRKYVFEYDLYLVCVENLQLRACLINVGMVVRCWIDLPIHVVTGHSSN